MIRFHYRKETSAVLGTVLRPVTDVVLESGSLKVEAALYIDSGADITMVPLGLGKALGFKQHEDDEIREIKGVSGGGVPYLPRKAFMTLDGKRLKIRLAWALIEEVPLLLGRLDIFPKFVIVFDEKQASIIFRS